MIKTGRVTCVMCASGNVTEQQVKSAQAGELVEQATRYTCSDCGSSFTA